ncbi:MAG: bifunctional precorrin-2 dehydrogenase/sirohydrochlorin ferrochelatase [Deltaproteobacteria bacterium]|nr:bifunctional precorrin-2 dehydrogenase/sirohydrochlorin ferrochelatase [Deltaproteobacteria bacterium]MBW2592669.1 bifunctional precorrin-2 dehydrogenase/sirohydrochlorin ferrochelatase [Deltaproteobacteria bacterium]
MRYYPVNLDIKNRHCLVVGGGRVGFRKVKTLIKCGALVTVVSSDIGDELQLLSNNTGITIKQRPYRSTDLDNMFLVIGATDNEDLNRRISEDAAKVNMLCNIADRPKVCNFILPAIIQRGDLVLTVSTSGKSPAFAKKLKKNLEIEFGEEYAEFLCLMGAVRKKLLSVKHAPEAHKHLFEQLIDGNLVDHIRNENIQAIDALLCSVLGPGYTFEELIASDSQGPGV